MGFLFIIIKQVMQPTTLILDLQNHVPFVPLISASVKVFGIAVTIF
jgi:hypothetical protein